MKFCKPRHLLINCIFKARRLQKIYDINRIINIELPDTCGFSPSPVLITVFALSTLSYRAGFGVDTWTGEPSSCFHYHFCHLPGMLHRQMVEAASNSCSSSSTILDAINVSQCIASHPIRQLPHHFLHELVLGLQACLSPFLHCLL